MTLDKPVIAAIHGAVAGVSTAFALSCDLRIMAEKCQLPLCLYQYWIGDRWRSRVVIGAGYRL